MSEDIDNDDKGHRGDTTNRATGITGQWAALGCSRLYWAVLDCTMLYPALLGPNGRCLGELVCTGLYWAAMDCTEWAVLGCLVVCSNGLLWAAQGFSWLYWAALV